MSKQQADKKKLERTIDRIIARARAATYTEVQDYKKRIKARIAIQNAYKQRYPKRSAILQQRQQSREVVNEPRPKKHQRIDNRESFRKTNVISPSSVFERKRQQIQNIQDEMLAQNYNHLNLLRDKINQERSKLL